MVKKAIFLILSLTLVARFTQPVYAEIYSGTCGTNVNWHLDTSTGELTISGSGEMKHYSSIAYFPWYSHLNSIKTVVSQNGVTGELDGFTGCTSLTSVTIGDSITMIGHYSFRGCSGLTKVVVPNSVYQIAQESFKDCSGLTEVTIGNGNSNCWAIGHSAFKNCVGLTKITIPNSVTLIDDSAFEYCSGLTDVTYQGTRNPGKSAASVFWGTQITSVNVPWNYNDLLFCGESISYLPSANFTKALNYCYQKLKAIFVFNFLFCMP